METRDWLQGPADPALQEKVRQKIALLQLFEQEIPAVLIVHDLLRDSIVYISQRGLDYLHVTLEEIRLSHAEYHDRFFNPEDARWYVPKILGLVERNNSDELFSCFQQVRQGEHQDWKWHLSSTKIFLRDDSGKPRLAITIALPVDTEHPIATKVSKVLEEQRFLQQHHHTFASLTKREKEILRLMALGVNSTEIAASLHISEATANTHRRNIRNKLQAQSNYDITRFAQASDLI